MHNAVVTALILTGEDCQINLLYTAFTVVYWVNTSQTTSIWQYLKPLIQYFLMRNAVVTALTLTGEDCQINLLYTAFTVVH